MMDAVRQQARLAAGSAILFVLASCAPDTAVKIDQPPVLPKESLEPLGYTIQAGAFSNLDNAVRLASELQHQDIEAYHFVDDSGFYKVRFGNFPSKNAARQRAETLLAARTIDAYYLVSPDDYAAVKYKPHLTDHIREQIVNTARRFIGVPYRWGGESPADGFDCSGLTKVVYELNGLQLPRSSREQWRAGKPVERDQIKRGDLIFFATSGGRRVSHVGIYAGDDTFLHAPRRGRKIRISSLANRYYRARYLGARSYF
jgi:cell wall-associated NlpC family hydrolase